MMMGQMVVPVFWSLAWVFLMMLFFSLLSKLRNKKKPGPKPEKLSEQLLKEIGTMHRFGRSGKMGYTMLERTGDQELWASLFEVDSSWARDDERLKWEKRQKIWMWLLLIELVLLVLGWVG